MVLGKVATLREALQPRTKKDVQRFLGLASCYTCFVPHFTTLATPLTDIMQGRGKGQALIAWNPDGAQAFQRMEEVLCSYLMRKTPIAGLNFLLYMDASEEVLGSILTQETPPTPRGNNSFSILVEN